MIFPCGRREPRGRWVVPPSAGADYGMLFDTFVNRVLTFEPAPLTAPTQMIEIRPASSAYSMRSWPCSSQINERMKFFIIYSSPLNVLLGWLLLTTLAVTVNQQ